MFLKVMQTILVSAAMFLFFGAMTLVTWGGSLLVLAFAAVMLPALLLVQRREAVSAAKAEWRSLAAAARLESLADKMAAPILITHQASTEVIYANAMAREFFGLDLVGRKAGDERDTAFRPIKVDGARFDQENHPALQMQATTKHRMRMNVTWLTPFGEKPFEMRASRLSAMEAAAGQFFFVRLHEIESLKQAA